MSADDFRDPRCQSTKHSVKGGERSVWSAGKEKKKYMLP